MLKFIQKLPGGIMVVPMVIGAIINTFCPEMVQIGSFTTGFALGGTINFSDILKAGPTGLILALVVLLVSGLSALLADRGINRRPGYAGMATATTA